MHEKYKLVGEILSLIVEDSMTIDDIDKELCKEYYLDWANLSNTRRRMDWLEVLGLIEAVGNRKWGLTTSGKQALDEWLILTPDVIDSVNNQILEININPPPTGINELLLKLLSNPDLHDKRNTYNIWVPSPNRIENLRTIVQFAFERVSRLDLFKFIEEEFSLKTSSVESMMPFLKADGLIEEVARNIYIATSQGEKSCVSRLRALAYAIERGI